MNKLCAPVYYKYRGNLKEEIFMNINFTGDVFKVVIVDDDEFSANSDISDLGFELRIKKSFFEQFISKYNLSAFSDDLGIVLTNREVQVLKYLAEGLNNHQISELLNVSVHTVKAHIHNIFEKLSVQGRTEAVVKAIKVNLISL